MSGPSRWQQDITQSRPPHSPHRRQPCDIYSRRQGGCGIGDSVPEREEPSTFRVKLHFSFFFQLFFLRVLSQDDLILSALVTTPLHALNLHLKNEQTKKPEMVSEIRAAVIPTNTQLSSALLSTFLLLWMVYSDLEAKWLAFHAPNIDLPGRGSLPSCPPSAIQTKGINLPACSLSSPKLYSSWPLL